MTNGIIDLMYQIAVVAMTLGKEISLEKKKYSSDSNGLGNTDGGHTEDSGIVLRVWASDKDEEQEDESND